MEKLNGLTQVQLDELCDFITEAIHDVVIEQADTCRQVIRDHQQPPVMQEEVRNAILLI